MGEAVFPPSSLAWSRTMVGITVIIVTSFKRTYASCCNSQDCCSQCPWPRGRPLLTLTSARDSRTLTGKSGSVSCHWSFLLGHGIHQVLLCPPKVCFPGGWFSVLLPDPQVGKSVVVPRTFATVWDLLCLIVPVCGLSARQLHSGNNGGVLQEDLGHVLGLPGLLPPEPVPMEGHCWPTPPQRLGAS